jgi:hypothetical protein
MKIRIGHLVILLVLMAIVFLNPFSLVNAGDKEELQWKARALVAEVNLAQQQLNSAIQAINAFKLEMDAKGFMFQQDGMIVEKTVKQPLPPEPKEKKK